MSLFKTLKAGYDFSQLWPKNEPYLAMFEQTKAVKLASLSLTVMPSLAMITAFIQFKYFGLSQVNLTLAMSILLLSLPIHAFYLLGQKAESALPTSLKTWYRELEAKMSQQRQKEQYQSAAAMDPVVQSSKTNKKLTFLDLAKILNQLFNVKK